VLSAAESNVITLTVTTTAVAAVEEALSAVEHSRA